MIIKRLENGQKWGGRLTVVAEEADDGVVAQSGQVDCVSNKERYPAHGVSKTAQKLQDAANYQWLLVIRGPKINCTTYSKTHTGKKARIATYILEYQHLEHPFLFSAKDRPTHIKTIPKLQLFPLFRLRK